jgi:hypothetical protein
MSNPGLPDDLARWPADPFKLLGVSRSAGPRDLRRAYTRLIRTYKPEQFPEHFRRIREAYEAALRHAERFNPPPTPASEPDREDGTRPEAAPWDDQEPSRPGSVFRPPSPEEMPESSAADGRAGESGRQEDRVEPWELACAGQDTLAYQRLLEQSQRHPGREDVYLRLYWLLATNPQLDRGRSRCDWLAQGLLATGLAGRLRELYRQEIAANPGEALSERCGRLLQGPAAPGRLADLVEWRWQAALRLQNWNLLWDDRHALRQRLSRADEAVWMRLLFKLVEGLAWADAEDARELRWVCRRELERHHHLAAAFSRDFDRLDFLLAVARDWRALRRQRGAPPALLDLMPLSWTRPFAEVRGPLQQVLAQISEAPQRWLTSFDGIKKHKGSAVLAQFGRVLDQLREQTEWLPPGGRSREVVAARVLGFLDGQGRRSYPQYRSTFLDFCLREAIAPEQVAEAVGDRPAHWPSTGVPLSQVLLDDWPIRYVFQAYQLFWA